MKVSVIIPTYKPKSYIWECLDSLTNQTFSKTDFEIILVLNGCNEPWRSQITTYVNYNMCGMHVKFLQTDIGGVSNARNIALDKAEGDFVTFIDDDDYVSPQFLELMYSIADKNTVVLSNVYAFDDNTPEIQRRYRMTDSYHRLASQGTIKFTKARKFFSGPCMKLIPMNHIKGRKFDTNFKNGEDTLFMFLISDCFSNVTCSDAGAIYYRRYRIGSAVTTSRSRSEIVRNEIKLLLKMLSIYVFHC